MSKQLVLELFSECAGSRFRTFGDGGKVSVIYTGNNAAQFVVYYPSTGVVGTRRRSPAHSVGGYKFE